MKRIFYYSGYRLTVFHWDKGRCIDNFAFNPGEEGIDKFRTYLRATVNTPARILVDLIEEDFNKETIPHVGATDRKSIITRMVDRHYRKSHDYVNYRVIGRESTGRKDDIILYCVLSNPEILEPWLKAIQEEDTAVCGIWSLPLLTTKLYHQLDCYSDNVLVVSQQVPSNLRQTFLKHGRFESSRSAVVNLDEATIGEYISSEIEQTIRFLSNQRHIGFDEKIEIHVICREQDIPDIETHCKDGVLRSFKYHKLHEFQENIGCEDTKSEYCNSLFSYLCAEQKLPIGHYGNKSTFLKYYEQLLSTGLYAASIVILITAIVLSFSYYSESQILNEEKVILAAQTTAINRDYQKTLSHLQSNLDKSELMQSTVNFAEKIVASRQVSPQSFMSVVSQSLSGIDLSNTQITKFTWKQKQEISPLPGAIASASRTSSRGIDYSTNTPIAHEASIGGEINLGNIGVKSSFQLANNILESLRQTRNIEQLDVITMPVDTRSESQLENEHGFESNTSARKDKAKFEFKLIMKEHSS